LEGVIKISDLGKLFVTIGSKFEKDGFDKARQSIDMLAKAALGMGTVFVAAALKSAQAAGEQERASVQLAQAMLTAGTYTEKAYQHNLDYASSLQKITTYTDEEIIAAQQSFIIFGIHGRMLDDLTRASLDLATAKGMDLASAANLVAKSVGSETNVLSRYGVVVDGAAGSIRRQNDALNGLTKLYSGQASAAADTYLGQMTVLKNRLGEIEEKFGQAVIPVVMEMAAVLNSVLPVIENFVTQLVDSGDATEYMVRGFGFIVKTAVGVRAALDIVGNGLVNYMKLQFAIMTLNPKLFMTAIRGWGQTIDKINDYADTLQKITDFEVKVRKRAETDKTKIIDNATKKNVKNIQEEKDAKLALTDQWIAAEQMKTDAYYLWLAEKRKIDFEEDIASFEAFYNYKNVKITNDMNDEINSENSKYESRKAWIIANITDETTRNKMLGDLEKSHAAAVSNIKNKAEQETKAARAKLKPLMIAEAIANTALGATKALAQWGYPLGAIMAALTIATGMAQIATIKAQKFAAGGMVNGATSAIIGEAGAEIALPLNHPNTTRALAEALSLAGGSAGSNIYVTVPPIGTRSEARRMGEIVGKEILRKVRANRKV
jgi:hypothetical protein